VAVRKGFACDNAGSLITAGERQLAPVLVLAPQRGLLSMGAVLRLWVPVIATFSPNCAGDHSSNMTSLVADLGSPAGLATFTVPTMALPPAPICTLPTLNTPRLARSAVPQLHEGVLCSGGLAALGVLPFLGNEAKHIIWLSHSVFPSSKSRSRMLNWIRSAGR
jgi:hypothetical protein